MTAGYKSERAISSLLEATDAKAIANFPATILPAFRFGEQTEHPAVDILGPIRVLVYTLETLNINF